MENIKIQKQSSLMVAGVEYILSMKANDVEMFVELESKYDTQIWKNTYTQAYIEDITTKTGNFKKFGLFAQMFSSAIGKSSDQVTLEILTYQDLENMKQQKMQQSGQSFKSNSSTQSQPNKVNKRYIILSYNSEFEKIHYPLPLNFEETIESSKLKGTIQRMKDELDSYKNLKATDDFGNSRESFMKNRDIESGTKKSLSQSQLTDQLKSENDLLKAKIKKIEELQSQKIGAIEVDNMIREKAQLTQELEAQKNHYQKEILKLVGEKEARDKELVMRQAEITAFKKELTNLIGKQEVDKRIQGYIQSMDLEEESQLTQAKKQIQKLESQLEKQNIEMENYKKGDTKCKQRIKQLETELETSMKKFSHKGLTDRLYSPFSNHSNKSYKSNYSAPNNKSNNNRVSPNSSKNSFNSRNTSNSGASAAKPKSYNNSPSYRNNQNASQNRKPLISNTNQVKPNQYKPFNKVQSATTKPVVNRSSPVISRSPVVAVNRQIPVNRNQSNRISPNQRNVPIQKQVPVRNQNQRVSPVTRQPQQMQKPQVNNPDFSDKHINQPKTELDNKINNLRSLLQKAKQ